MFIQFSKNIAFTKLVKADDRLREFNFRKLQAVETGLFHVDVSDDRGNRIMFHMHLENGGWKIDNSVVPQWVRNAEGQLHEKIEQEIG